MHLNESNGYWYLRRHTDDGKETVAKLGQHDERPSIYRPELIQDKAENVLGRLPDSSIDCIVTDPPFGVDMEVGQRGVGVANMGKNGATHGNVHNHGSTDFLEGLAQEFHRVLKDDSHCYVFTNYKAYPAFKAEFEQEFNLSQVLVWDKEWQGSGPPNTWLPAHEWVLHLKKGSPQIHGTLEPNILRCRRTRYLEEFKIHPTQKPRQLMEKIIEKSTRPGEVVFDPFGGSYAVPRAAQRTFRRSLSCELDPEIHRDAASLTRSELQDDPEYGIDWTELANLSVEPSAVLEEAAIADGGTVE